MSPSPLYGKNIILRNKFKLPSGLYVKKNYSKQLQSQVEEKKKERNVAFLKYDKLIVKKPIDINREKKKEREIGFIKLANAKKKLTH